MELNKLSKEEKLLIYTGLEMYWKNELNRKNQKVSRAKEIDNLRKKFSESIK